MQLATLFNTEYIAYCKNLLTYTLSGSRLLVTYNGSKMAAGSYSLLTTWLTEQVKDEISIPDGVVWCVFDNEQVTGKNYMVKAPEHSNIKCSHKPYNFFSWQAQWHSERRKAEAKKLAFW